MKYNILSLLISSLILVSCAPNIYYTSSGGVRLKNPNRWFQYKSKSQDKTYMNIDTNFVFQLSLMDNTKLPNLDSVPYSEHGGIKIARFFSTGQILFFTEKANFPIEEQINDSLAGIQGYYTVDESIIMFQKWTNIFGNQTPKRIGIILNDSTLKLYYPGASITSIKRDNDNLRFSIWKRNKKYKVEHYSPNW